MRARGNPMDEDGESDRPDFVISDGDGETSDPAFTKFVSNYLIGKGFTAPCNDPYKGADLVRRYSDPARGRYSIQIEINRKLYMNETSYDLLGNSDKMKNLFSDLISTLINKTLEKCPKAAE